MVIDGSKLNVSTRIDTIDVFLASQDGKIVRHDRLSRCKHGPRQKCSDCLPIDSYDAEYLKEKQIKHMSFHAYVKKLTDLHGKGTRLNKPLENVKCKLQIDCKGGHKPYPKGICTKCRPPTLTLNRQPFRHVDNITFENEELVNNFLNFWRSSSYQRVGYLIGRYEAFPDVPLGIKAIVCAIYEPPQTSGEDFVTFDEDPNEDVVESLCGFLNMKCIGWIFTDLWSADLSEGTVHCIRHEDSFLLSAADCITAGNFQNKFKNYTSFCYDEYFGSKFVTVVATGDQSKHINFSGYQVSNQCAAMVEADILCPTTAFPELAYIRETPLHEAHYITDVQYTKKDEYGAEVRCDGRPMPVEYLLVDVPTGVPKEPQYTFTPVQNNPFPIENRVLIGETQNLKSLALYASKYTDANQFLEFASNFHFLLFLLTNSFVKFSEEEVGQLAAFVLKRDVNGAREWAENSENWATLVELFKSVDLTETNIAETSTTTSNSNNVKWSCAHCTFENTERRSDCVMCGLPFEQR